MLPSVHHASTDEPDRLAGLPLAHARPVDRVTMRSNVLQREILMALVSIARDTGDFALALRHARELVTLDPADAHASLGSRKAPGPLAGTQFSRPSADELNCDMRSGIGTEGTIERAGGPSGCWGEADAPLQLQDLSSWFVWDLAEVEARLDARRSKPIARAQSPDVSHRHARPVNARHPVQSA